MTEEEIVELIRTPRLELVPVSESFARALVDRDRGRAVSVIGAGVSPWLIANSACVVQLVLAQALADRVMPPGVARMVVLIDTSANVTQCATNGASGSGGRVPAGY